MDSPTQSAASTPAAGRSLRGRPRANETAPRDAYILGVAERLFLAHGFRQVSLAYVAKSAGVAARTIYARFGGKLGMLDRIIKERSSDAGLVTALAEVEGDPRAALRVLASHAFEHTLSERMNLLHADATATRVANTGSGIGRLHGGLWYDMLAKVLKDGQWLLGQAPVAEIAIVADFFIGCLIREFASLTCLEESGSVQSDLPCALAERTVLRFFTIASIR